MAGKKQDSMKNELDRMLYAAQKAEVDAGEGKMNTLPQLFPQTMVNLTGTEAEEMLQRAILDIDRYGRNVHTCFYGKSCINVGISHSACIECKSFKWKGFGR